MTKHKSVGSFFKSRRKGKARSFLDRETNRTDGKDAIRINGIYSSDGDHALVRKVSHVVADVLVNRGKAVTGYFWKRGGKR
jgi:hypothetical protein